MKAEPAVLQTALVDHLSTLAIKFYVNFLSLERESDPRPPRLAGRSSFSEPREGIGPSTSPLSGALIFF